MVELHVLDDSAVYVGSVTYTGPLNVVADGVTVAGNYFGKGTVLVQGGTAHVVSQFTAEENAILPFFVMITFLLGMLWARNGFFGARPV